MASPLRNGTPFLNRNTFLDSSSGSVISSRDGAMTLNGTVNKTSFLLVLVLCGAMYSWSQFKGPDSIDALAPLAMIGALGGFVVAMITIFKKEWSAFTAPVYAALEGLALGAISSLFELRYPGVVMQAVALTFGTMGAMLFAYRTGLIRVTEKFKLGVFAAMMGILLVYVADMVMGLFGHQIGMINSNTPLGIGFSVFVVIIAALRLVLNFDMIEQGVTARAPKYMEWYGGFALVITLVWLYLEILQLLSKLNSRNGG